MPMGLRYWAPVVHSSSPPLWDEALIPPSGWVSPLPCPRLYPMGISLWSKDGQCEKGVPRGQEWGMKTRLNSGNFWRAIWAPWDGWRLLLVHHSVYSSAQTCFWHCCWNLLPMNFCLSKLFLRIGLRLLSKREGRENTYKLTLLHIN